MPGGSWGIISLSPLGRNGGLEDMEDYSWFRQMAGWGQTELVLFGKSK